MNFESWLSKKVGAALARLVMLKERKRIFKFLTLKMKQGRAQ